MYTQTYTTTQYSSFTKNIIHTDDCFFYVHANRRDTHTGYAVSISVAIVEHDAFAVTQWISEDKPNEKNVLLAFIFWCKTHPVHMIGYNSTGFSIPFIRTRCDAYHLPDPFCSHRISDLLYLLRPVNEKLKLSSLTPGSIVKWLGIPHLDGIDALLACASLLTYRELFTGGFSIDHMIHHENHLQIDGTLTVPLPRAINCVQEPFHLSAMDHSLSCQLKLYNGRLRIYYKNYHDYRYFPAEDIAIHKSIAKYSDESVSVPATLQTCYGYIMCPKADNQGKAQLHAYLTSLLSV